MQIWYMADKREQQIFYCFQVKQVRQSWIWEGLWRMSDCAAHEPKETKWDQENCDLNTQMEQYEYT